MFNVVYWLRGDVVKKSVIIGIILALIVVCLAIVLVVNLNDKANSDEILVSDTNQVEVLKKIISSEVPNDTPFNVKLHSVLYNNLITGKPYAEDALNELLSLEKEIEEPVDTYIVSALYSRDNSILAVTIQSKYLEKTSYYRLSVSYGKISYEPVKGGTTVNKDYAE